MANLNSKKFNNTPTTGDSAQYISITDVLCEGPIHGLVEGTKSVYLNDVSSEQAKYARYTPNARSTITFGNNDTTGELDDATFLPDSIVAVTAGKKRKLWLRKYKEATNRTIASVTKQTGQWRIELSGNSLGAAFSTQNIADREGTLVWNGITVPCEMESSSSNYAYVSNQYDVGNAGVAAGQDIDFYIDQAFDIDQIDTTGTVTIASGNTPVAGTYNFYIGAQYQYASEQGDTQSPSPLDADYFNLPIQKVDGVYVQEREGYGIQDPVKDVGNVGGSQVTNGDINLVSLKTLKLLNPDLAVSKIGYQVFDPDGMPNTSSYGGDQKDYPGDPDFSDCNDDVTVIGSEAFGLDTAAKIAQCDKISFSIGYPQICGINNEKGLRIEVFAFYDVRLRFKRGGVWQSTTFSDLQEVWEPYLQHKGKRTGATTFQHIIDLQRFRPFEDFDLRIARITRHTGLPVGSDGLPAGDKNKTLRTNNSLSEITNLSSTSEDLFTYPYTALANVSFSSKQYQTTPQRSYDLKGKLVKVPTTYTTREETSSGVAEYEDFWSGDFKDELVWTDNPAWIFYDMLTNNRYGAGKYIPDTYIDKYALYRISKYCDELVDSGDQTTPDNFAKGDWYEIVSLGNTNWNTVGNTSGLTYSVGDRVRVYNTPASTGIGTRLEPRFKMNLFLTKDEPVYKVLKDMASSFTAILYWMDGQLHLMQDVPQDSVYTFSQSNVIDGKFSYETTGQKTRANQYIVQYNNPDANYEPDQVIVEDTNSIISTNKIITENAVAFGVTSESQAIRYGKWKLWTAQNQLEAVNFKTSFEGAYIRPGDIINIQDRDRYGVSLSGRVKQSGTASIQFDRDIQFDASRDYELWVMHSKPAAFYVGATAITINSVTYTRGDILPEAYVINSDGTYSLEDLTTESLASQAYSSPTDTAVIPTVWKKYTYSKGYEITNPGNTTDTVTITSGTFDHIPTVGSIWGLKDITYNNVEIAGNLKSYKVMGVSKEDRNIYAITAIEHYNQKFDAIEDRYELSVVPPTIYPLNEPDVIPPPLNPRVYPSGPSNDPYSELTLDWDPPVTTFVASYEVKSNMPGSTLISTSKTQHVYTNVQPGRYTFRIRTMSPQGDASDYVNVTVDATPIQNPAIQYIHNLPKGAYANYRGWINDDTEGSEYFYFEKYPITIASVADPGNPITITEASGDGNIDLSGVDIYDTRELYVVLDHSESKVFLGEWWDYFTDNGPGFWRDIGNGNNPNMANAWTSIGTTCLLSANDNKLRGYNTGTILSVGTPINLSGTTVEADMDIGAVVTGVFTDSQGPYVTLDRTFPYNIAQEAYKPTYEPDTTSDAVVCLVKEVN